MNETILAIKKEVKKAISGKDDVISQVLTAILAGGHILLEDIPGVGKTTLALAMSRALGLAFARVQFTPDVVPSDITGFTVYDKEKGVFRYRRGAVLTNFFLADEINRTSSKTQAALLQVMQEGCVTVDGRTYRVPEPFIVMATQNPVGTAGTQMLPEAQLDRFMIKVSMGYPDIDDEIDILKNRETSDPLNTVRAVLAPEDLVQIKQEVSHVFVDDKIYEYITLLASASREHAYVRLGISPRGSLAVASMARACAYMEGRNYVVPEDVQAVFVNSCRHRLVLLPKAGLNDKDSDLVLLEILKNTRAPKVGR
ncbi:MAG: MoxR family ATPase [Eubacterium sp.]|nr:MoxR family ATPase [Eubacterium sp.]